MGQETAAPPLRVTFRAPRKRSGQLARERTCQGQGAELRQAAKKHGEKKRVDMLASSPRSLSWLSRHCQPCPHA